MTAKKIGSYLLFSLFTQFNVHAQEKKEFILQGKIEGLPDGTNVVLKKGKDTLAKTISHGELFEFKGQIIGEANYYFLSLDTDTKRPSSKALWLVNDTMQVSGSLMSWPKLSLKGSEAQDEYQEIMEIQKKARGNNQEITEIEMEALQAFINTHPNSLYISELIIKLAGILPAGFIYDAYSKLTPRAKTSYYGLKLGNEIASLKKAEELQKSTSPGIFPNFSITSADEKKMSVIEIASKAKYTLIDFWASWCAPCRAANPDLLKVYKAFHSKGFEILSISIDKRKADWKKAMIEDKLPWIQGRDDIDNAEKNILFLSAIPAYILIDTNGRIIQANCISSKPDLFKGNSSKKNLNTNLSEIVDSLFKQPVATN